MEIQTFRINHEVTAMIKFTPDEAAFAEEEWGGIEEAVRDQLEMMISSFATDGGFEYGQI